MDENNRLLVVDEDAARREQQLSVLTSAGFDVRGLENPRQSVGEVISYRPAAVLVAQQMSSLSGREVIRLLRCTHESSGVPGVLLLSDPSELDLLRALWAGASEVLTLPLTEAVAPRLREVIRDGAHAALQEAGRGPVAQRLLALYRRLGRTGTLVLNPGTPFGGHATFESGELVEAVLGPASGLEALEEMLWFEEGVWRFEPKGAPLQTPQETPVSHGSSEPASLLVPAATEAQATFVPKVLVVDDEGDIRQLFQAYLARAGCEVRIAETGERGLAAVRSEKPDLVLADIHMPRLDGWGMLRQLRADPLLRRTPLVFLSGHDDARETLEAARAGAADYLSKRLPPQAVVERVLKLTRPLADLHHALASGRRVSFDPANVGVVWVMRRLIGPLKATGLLALNDAWGRHGVRFQRGQPFDAVTTTARHDASDFAAFAALVQARRGEASFVPGPVEGSPRFLAPLDTLLDNVTSALTRFQGHMLQKRLLEAPSFEIEPSLAELYRSLAPASHVAVLRALEEGSVPPAELSAQLGLSPEEVEEVLVELFNRRVIRLPER